jgi:hypothetical protein
MTHAFSSRLEIARLRSQVQPAAISRRCWRRTVSEVVHGDEPPLLVPASAGGLQIVVTPMIDNNGIPGSTPHVV